MIVNISSPAAIHGGIGSYVDFAASKVALDRQTAAAAQEQAPHGLRINGLRPGLVMTESNQAWSDEHPDWLPSIVAQQPIGRQSDAKEIAAAVMWLLSDDSSNVVATVMDVSISFTARQLQDITARQDNYPDREGRLSLSPEF